MALWVELLGYAASLLILVSLTMRSLVRLRVINAVGSALFVAYAVMLGSIPTIAMNSGIVLIDLWYVWRVRRQRGDYELVKAERGSAWLEWFYAKHRAEIDSIFGDTAFAEARGFSWFLCDGKPAGLFAWKENSPTECHILIDFVTVEYRDTKIGKYFFDRQLPYFREKGYTRFVYLNVGKKHWKYLEKIGFVAESPGCFAKDFASVAP
jgi:GNAT superfamily N-acetyltransferase